MDSHRLLKREREGSPKRSKKHKKKKKKKISSKKRGEVNHHF